ncbi:MAG: hypothetical protein JWN38_516 [Candidatus Saccharibacteria bacterium]|nr:hypothetical protein [Candidatus Saccharibacteria bacterium]
MARSLETFTDVLSFQQAITRSTLDEQPKMFLGELEGGALRFAEAAFRGMNTSSLYVQQQYREPGGRGPHFDVYDGLLDPDWPYAAVYNLAGRAAISATTLDSAMHRNYRATYPERTQDAEAARRVIGAMAFAAPGARIFNGILQPGTGFILPQRRDILPIVHQIVPLEPEAPGAILKFVAPFRDGECKQTLRDAGYTTLDEFATNTFAGVQGQADTPQPSSFDSTRKARDLGLLDGRGRSRIARPVPPARSGGLLN